MTNNSHKRDEDKNTHETKPSTHSDVVNPTLTAIKFGHLP